MLFLPFFDHFWALLFSGSVSLARVTPSVPCSHSFSFFLSFVSCLGNILDVTTKRDGYLRCTKKIAERVFISEVESFTRARMTWYDMV